MTQPAGDSQGLSIHDEVYKARPEVKAILYARTPEIVAFTEGSDRLRPVVNGGAFIGDGFPVFNLGSLDPQQPILANPAFARGVAQALGKESAVFLAGHGFVLTASSVYNLADRAYALRQNALIQQQASALRGRVAHLDDRPVAPQPAAAQPAPAGPTLGPPRRSRLDLLEGPGVVRLSKAQNLAFAGPDRKTLYTSAPERCSRSRRSRRAFRVERSNDV